jgi:hypothetical protein
MRGVFAIKARRFGALSFVAPSLSVCCSSHAMTFVDVSVGLVLASCFVDGTRGRALK